MRKQKGLIKEDLIIIVAGLSLLALIVLASYISPGRNSVSVTVDRSNYVAGETLRVKIENHLGNSICFSSCYPYYFEKAGDLWTKYNYSNCQKENRASVCINNNESKAFAVEIPEMIRSGDHRLALPACIGCAVDRVFEESSVFYSKIFMINK